MLQIYVCSKMLIFRKLFYMYLHNFFLPLIFTLISLITYHFVAVNVRYLSNKPTKHIAVLQIAE
jgi:hypothetical protein